MREPHHIYNFHIGFWGSLLISLVIMIQSAIFLVFSAAATRAQTAPIVITSPQAGAVFNIGVAVPLTAQMATPSFSSVQFSVVDSASGQPVFNGTGTSVDQMAWAGVTWTTSNPGAFDITATNGQFTSAPLRVTVQAAQQVTATLTAPSADGLIITQDFNLAARTSVAVDSLTFILTDTATGASQSVNGAPDANKINWTGALLMNAFVDGQYLVTARATLSTQSVDSTGFTITVQHPAATPTLNITSPLNQSTLNGSVTFSVKASQQAQSVQFVLTGATGTPTEGVLQNLAAIYNPVTDLWTAANFDTTTVANGSYSLIASATFAGQTQPILSQNIAVTVNNVAQAAPLAIQSTGLPTGTVGTQYNGLLVATGGTLPYTWNITNGNLPAGLTLQGATGVVAGIPTTAGASTLTFRVSDAQARTANVTITITIDPAPAAPAPTNPTAPAPAPTNPTAPAPTPTAPAPTPTAPTVTTTVTISSPAANAKIVDGQVTVVVNANVAIVAPTIRLFNVANVNVLANSTARAVVDGADNKTWNYNLNTAGLANGTYQLQAIARAEGATADTLSQQVTITIENAPKQASTFIGGSISAPQNGQKVSGRVLLNATINGTIKSLVFKVSTNLGVTDVPGRQQAGSATIWEGSWDATSLPAGSFSVSASVETDIGQVITLPATQAFIVATTAPLLVAPVPAIVPPAPIEQIVPPQILQNVDATNGTIVQTPVECQIVAIRDEARCRDYLRTREIRLLSDAEQQKVKQDLGPIVTRHIDIENGLAMTQGEQRPVQDPLSEIIPFDKKKSRDTSVLVVSSTEPPANIKPFVMQTVPAVLTLDQDGDGLPDEAETRYGTDVKNPDSDGDGYNDGTEIKNGFDPLGTGVLTTPIAPMDEAILNKRPVEQPRFAGAVDKEKMKVDDVTSAAEGELSLRGKADPYAYVTLYIYSSLPIVVTVQANESGDWQYEFSHPLVDGKHDVYATVTNNTGKIVKKSEPLAFFVRGAQAVTEDEFLATSTVSDSSAQFLLYYVLAGAFIVILGGGLFFFYLRRREHFI